MIPAQRSLFDAPEPPRQPIGVRRAVPPHEAEILAQWVQAALGEAGEALLVLAERAANAILDAQGSVAVWEVRIGLAGVGKLANDGKETLDAFGALGRRMGLVPIGAERPPAWAMALLEKSHGNRHTRWRRPRSGEERAALAAADDCEAGRKIFTNLPDCRGKTASYAQSFHN